MIKHEHGDLFEGNCDIIVHQVNCQGVMGSGVAKQVRRKFTYAYKKYLEKCASANSPEELLCNIQVVRETREDGRNVYIVHMFSQEYYGYDGRQYTNYEAFQKCLIRLRDEITKTKNGKYFKIGMPYLIGCDRGGGDWNVVYRIIKDELEDFDVTLYEL